MENSALRLREMKAFVRMACGGETLRQLGWNGNGVGDGVAQQLANMESIVQGADGNVHFAEWHCRAGQSSVIIRTDGTLGPCFPVYSSPVDWGNLDGPKFDQEQLLSLKKTCQQHCFSTLNHILAAYYDDSWVINYALSHLARSFSEKGEQASEGVNNHIGCGPGVPRAELCLGCDLNRHGEAQSVGETSSPLRLRRTKIQGRQTVPVILGKTIKLL